MVMRSWEEGVSGAERGPDEMGSGPRWGRTRGRDGNPLLMGVGLVCLDHKMGV